MGLRERYEPGTFSWAELVTSDAGAAKAFYGELFGWTYDDRPAGDGVYTMVRRDGRDVAGLFADPQQPPHWNSYVTVADADEAAERAADLGAAVAAPPFDVGDSGRMAVVQDPTGAFVAVWEARQHPGSRLVNTHGAPTWNDLVTRDVDAAARFYGEWLGWTTEEMPDSGGYRVIRNGGRTNGGMVPWRPEMGEDAPPSWMPYFGIIDLEAALDRVRALGGAVFAGPSPMPDGSIAVLGDPQRAVFALWTGEYDDDPV